MFKVAQPKLEAREKLYEYELKIKNNGTARFVPLHGADECLTIWAHTNVKTSMGFQPVACGKRNEHLFDVMPCPFCSHPDEKVSKPKLHRFMLVYVLDGSDSGTPKSVGYLELKYSQYAALKSWEDGMSREMGSDTTVKNYKVTISRKGNGFDTEYATTVITQFPVVLEDGNAELLSKLAEYLEGRYTKQTEETLNKLFESALVGGESKASPKETVAKEEADEIPF